MFKSRLSADAPCRAASSTTRPNFRHTRVRLPRDAGTGGGAGAGPQQRHAVPHRLGLNERAINQAELHRLMNFIPS